MILQICLALLTGLLLISMVFLVLSHKKCENTSDNYNFLLFCPTKTRQKNAKRTSAAGLPGRSKVGAGTGWPFGGWGVVRGFHAVERK